MLNASELFRYSRQVRLPEIGESGQARLKNASVLIVGAGGLGTPAATYLAAAGVGKIGLVDCDALDETNLHRQILYREAAVGQPKVEVARERLEELNAAVHVVTHHERLNAANALGIISNYDVVLDGTDNFPTRYLVNDACVLLGKPNVYGSVFRFDGQASLFNVGNAPCYRCLYPDAPAPHLVPSCAEAGVLGVVPGVIGTIQATEAIKLITGAGETLAGRLLLFDALRMTFRTIRLPRRCDEHPPVTRLIDEEEFCKTVHPTDITPKEVAEKLSRGESVALIDVREPYEWSAGHIDGAQHIPLAQLPQRLGDLPRESEIVMICRSGGRSERARQFLQQSGFGSVRNMVGGMQRWARDVDATIRVA